MVRRPLDSSLRSSLGVSGLALVLVLVGVAHAEPWEASIELGGEVDSNVRRIAVTPSGPGREAAPLVRALGELRRGWKKGERLRGALRLGGGSRFVVTDAVQGEDLVIGAIDASIERDGPGDAVALLARATHYDVFPIDGEDGARAFASSGADLGARLLADEGRTATFTAGLRRLRYKPEPDFDWLGQQASLRVADELWRAADEERWLELAVGYRVERRAYRGVAFTDGCAPGEPRTPSCFVPTREPRGDLQHVGAVELTYTGTAVLSAAYQLVVNDSSSFGSSYDRHRLSLSATTSLGRWFATATATAQLDRYPDPLLVTDDLNQTFASIDDENRSGGALRLARGLSDTWELEGRYAFQADASGGDDRTYRRHLVYVGVTWERDPEP